MISGVISRVTIILLHIRGLITPLLTTHEPPSSQKEWDRYVCLFALQELFDGDPLSRSWCNPKPIIQSPLNLKHIVSVVLLIDNIIIMTNNHIIVLRLHSSRLAAGNLPQYSYSHYDH